jgi:D-lyxose ketol-isomerase
MLDKELYRKTCARAFAMLDKAGIEITENEHASMEVAEYGLDMLDTIGLELIVYVNTDRCCAKELVLFPGQTCPEHRHPEIQGESGKEETFRCRWGEVYLYISGDTTSHIRAKIPSGKEKYFTVMKEIVLTPGKQYTLPPDTLHWFQAGPNGAIISEFSTKSRDEFDIYTDPSINPAHERKA